jgi:hypothetical protein
MASGERSAPARDGTDGTFEANIDIDRLRMELEMQTPFQAQGPGKPSERDHCEEEEAEAALHALSSLEMPAPSPHQEISCDDENVLRNEATAHCGDLRNEASDDGDGREMDATTESRSDETEFGHSRSSPGNVERSAPARDRAEGSLEGSLEASLDIEQLRRELEMQTPFRANTPGKPSERDRREMEEAVAAYNFAVRRAAERGRRTSDAEGKENGARESTNLDTS